MKKNHLEAKSLSPLKSVCFDPRVYINSEEMTDNDSKDRKRCLSKDRETNFVCDKTMFFNIQMDDALMITYVPIDWQIECHYDTKINVVMWNVFTSFPLDHHQQWKNDYIDRYKENTLWYCRFLESCWMKIMMQFSPKSNEWNHIDHFFAQDINTKKNLLLPTEEIMNRTNLLKDIEVKKTVKKKINDSARTLYFRTVRSLDSPIRGRFNSVQMATSVDRQSNRYIHEDVFS